MAKRQTNLAKIVHPSSKITHPKVINFVTQTQNFIDFFFFFFGAYLIKSYKNMLYSLLIFTASNIQRTKLSQDRLSDLPDEILVSILSLLKLEERQRTSILSRRWRYLWTFVTCNLVFDKSRLQPVWEKFKCHEISIADFRTALSTERSKFIVWVNDVLELQQGDTIDEFRVFFDMDGTFSAVLDNWIRFLGQNLLFRLFLEILLVNSMHVKLIS